MKLLDVVVLSAALPEDGLAAGATGTIVHVFHSPRLAYEVEFVNSDGETAALVTLRPDQVHPVD
ncbi:MAG TPA: DUF4926 domain-containing protein [Pilimelia sp.]|nr:DUF4926 domain-containing protein [Pilimelia sp.]